MRNPRRVLHACALLACASLGKVAMGDTGPAAASPFEPFSLTPSDARPLYAAAAPTSGPTPVPGALTPPPPAAAPEEAPRPLMGLLMKTPAGQYLKDARINIYGWIEGSYEYNFNVRDHSPNAGRAYDVLENNKGYLNQLDLTFERTIDVTQKQFDVGGKMDLVYGSDARFTPSSGLLDRQASFSQEAWFDIHQLYLDFALPVGNGVRLRVGKFEFFKILDPNASTFYTHPYEYGNGFPYTLTGISAQTSISPQMTIEGGISRGWDQTLRDNNSAALDGFGRFAWDINDKSRFTISAITGPEQFKDNVHFTTAVDATYEYTVSEPLLLLFDVVYGHQSGAQLGGFPGSNSPSGIPGARSIGGVNSYGLNVAAIYKINDMVTLNARAEWYRDEEGYYFGETQVDTSSGIAVFTPRGTNLYEATIGLTVTPFHNTALGDNFILRPEIRYDYSSHDFFHLNSFGVGTRHDQFTIAMDAIFNF